MSRSRHPLVALRKTTLAIMLTPVFLPAALTLAVDALGRIFTPAEPWDLAPAEDLWPALGDAKVSVFPRTPEPIAA